MRKYYLDNLRYGVVISVILYHIVYLFNSVGVIRNVDIQGVPQMDLLLYILNPWFMAFLFLVSGISARYALQKRTNKEFIRERARHILVPSIAVVFLLGWMVGIVNNYYYDMFQGNGAQIPGLVKYLIYSVACGIGPMWFCHELFLGCLLLLLIRKVDKKDKLWQIGGKAKLPALLLLFFLVWGSSQVLNTPLIEVYRHGIYLTMFLLGYAVFSHEEVEETLVKWRLAFLVAAVILGIAYVWQMWGENYAMTANLKSPLVNGYAWMAILALLGYGKAYLNKETAFTRYMRPRSFAFYVLHNYLIVVFGYGIDRLLHPASIVYYLLEVVLLAVLMPLLYELLSRIPVVRRLLFGL